MDVELDSFPGANFFDSVSAFKVAMKSSLLVMQFEFLPVLSNMFIDT